MDNTLSLLDHALADLTRLREELTAREAAPSDVAQVDEGLSAFLALSERVTAKWKGPSSVDAIRYERGDR